MTAPTPTEARRSPWTPLEWEQAFDRAAGYSGLADDRPNVAGSAKAIEIVEVPRAIERSEPA